MSELPTLAPGQRAATPRHAASLVLLRRDADATRVLMGRRAPKNRFMPDVFVFPGGGVQREDARADAKSELRPEVANKLCERATPKMARALGVAALRETYEETGLVVGTPTGTETLEPDLATIDFFFRAVTPRQNPIRFHARFFFCEAVCATGDVRSNGELLDLGWRTIDEALALPLVDVTEEVLKETRRRAEGEVAPRIPFFSYRNRKPLLIR